MTPIVRFAPSPTGRLHIGNIRAAILNWLLARKHGGTFILRLDDTDRERSTDAFAESIREDLRWLGLDWAREERQSARLARYAQIADTLKAAGRLYPAYETEDELDRRRKRQRAMGRPPIYDRAALKLTDLERKKLEAEGRRPHWRFRLGNTAPGRGLEPMPTLVSWLDLVRGDQSVDIGSLSDPVLVREDGTPLYTFTSVVDDVDFGVDHVLRGEDHVTNTGVQIELFEALGAPPPAFAHVSLLVDKDGKALSKRLGSVSIAGLRQAGLEPQAVVTLSALIGTSHPIEPHATLDTLAATFEFGALSRSPARFDDADLYAINARILQSLAFEKVGPRLRKLGVTDAAAAGFWRAVKGNLRVFADVEAWWRVVSGPIAPAIEDARLCATAAELLPPEPWDETTWGDWTRALKQQTAETGRQLFHPLRLALTGGEHGPELKMLLPLIGRGRAAKRLRGEAD